MQVANPLVGFFGHGSGPFYSVKADVLTSKRQEFRKKLLWLRGAPYY